MNMSTTIDQNKVRESIQFLKSQPPLERHPGFTAPYTQLTLADVAPTQKFEDDTKEVWTDVGGAVVFADPFPGGMKQDILYSWEYAQRWANKQIHDKYGKTDANADNADTKFTHAQEWYNHFTDKLSILHWITKDFDFSPVEVSGSTFTVDKVILDVLATFLGDDAQSVAAVKEAIGVLKSLGGNDSRLTLWDSHTNSAGKGSFQMGAVRDGGGGLPTLRAGALQIDSTKTTTDVFFFFHYSSSDTKVVKASQDLIFHQKAYRAKDEHGDSAKSLVEAAVVGTSTENLQNDGGIE